MLRHFLPLLLLMGCSNASNSQYNLKDDSTGTYRITATVEVLKPVNLDAMNNDAQTFKLLSESDSTVKLEVTVNPNADQLSDLTPNLDWKNDYQNDSSLKKFLQPGRTTNWDDSMRAELISALKQDGIDPDSLSDVQLVEAVSKWIFSSSEFNFMDHFVSYAVDFSGGQEKIIPELKDAFDYEKQKNNISSDQEALELGIYGKSMFKARKYGNCTASATLQATILKALGIPTRLVVDIPVADANDSKQIQLIKENISHHGLRKTILQGTIPLVGSWSSHTFNEVYVGNKWVRLNYTNLGQKPADAQYFGLMIQVQQMADWADGNMGMTWGIHAQSKRIVNLSSQNPYRTLKIEDTKSVLNDTNNPPVPLEELTA